MASHLEIGFKGEKEAQSYLEKLGFTLLHLNWRYKHYEVDIIAQKDNYIHFVEVKTRAEKSLVPAIKTFSKKKQENLEKAAFAWFQENTHFDGFAQLDFIAITYTKTGAYHLEYFPNCTQ